MDSEKVIKRDNEYVLHTYNRNPIVLEKGHGLRAAGPEGQQYLDFTSGIGVNSLGYCDLDWAEAVSEQAHKLQHTSNLYYTAPCGKLAKKLCKRTGMSKVFFGNSGAEANEGAIKAARKYSVDHYRKDRTTVITLVNSFHGRTIATLTATGQEVFHNYFGPFNEGFLYAPAGDIEALEELVDRTTCAVMLELIQGEGGVNPAPVEWLQRIRKVTEEHGILLIVDEVQAGFARTGKFFAFEHAGIQPDIIVMSKAVGGGLPLAVLGIKKQFDAWEPGHHTGTFRGNQLAMATGLTTLRHLRDNKIADKVAAQGEWLKGKLAELQKRYPVIGHVRGLGLMIGIEIVKPNEAQDHMGCYPADGELSALLQKKCFEAGLILERGGRHGCVLRLLPSLLISDAELDVFLDKFEQALLAAGVKPV